MANLDINDLNSSVIPFFTRYLEEQVCQDLSEEETQAINGGILAPGALDDGNLPPDINKIRELTGKTLDRFLVF